MVVGNCGKINDGGLWDELITHQGEQFATCEQDSLPGKHFIYKIEGGEMFISTNEKSITKASVVMAYQKALSIQAQDGCVTDSKRIGTFWSELHEHFIIVDERCNLTKDTRWEDDSLEEMEK